MEDSYEIKTLGFNEGFSWQNELGIPLLGIFKNGKFIEGTQSNKFDKLTKVIKKLQKENTK